jgi:phosphoadenosine phosphosulfate reductase
MAIGHMTPPVQLRTLITNEALAVQSRRFESAPATEIVAWALDRFAGDLVIATSFQDCVLIDLVTSVEPGAEFVFIDTGFHFPETLRYVDQVKSRYELNLTVLNAGLADDVHPCGSASCCQLRKVEPMRQYLAGRGAWVSGLRRSEAKTRRRAPIVSWDEAKGVVKVNPIANWSDDDVYRYTAAHELPRHPLTDFGYLSIGCAPTTVPVALGADPRSGRWAGTTKTECGLHV